VKKESDKVRFYCPNHFACPAQMREKIAFAV
jgi:NAD-dependent DNA ligase